MTDWERLKPRILQDLADGKTQQQIRQELADDPDDTWRASISKSQLETQLKHWKYRQGLHEPEWKVVSHRINKRRKAGKPSSQVLVNGFIFNERKVAKAINRYDTPRLVHRLPSPQIPPELSHHLIEVRTPPSSHRSLQSQPSQGTVLHKRCERFSLNLHSARIIWPRNTQWGNVELSVEQFVARFFLPTYKQDETLREAFERFGREFPVSQIHQAENVSASNSEHNMLSQAQARHPLPDFRYSVAVDRDEMQISFGGSNIHTAVVKTLVGLLYGLSNHTLDDAGRETLLSIMEAPSWDAVAPHLRDVLNMIDSKIVDAIAEGLLKESVRTCHHRMLDLSLGLGADPTRRIKFWDIHERRHVISTPLIALCNNYSHGLAQGMRESNPEKLIHSLLKRDPHVSDSTLLCIIRASCHAIAEDVIRSQPARAIDFAIAVSDLERGSWISSDTYDPVTPLLVACSDLGQSAEKLSLIRCLLERDAKADLEVMVAAAGAFDTAVISLLHQHGAPVTGFIPHIGSPLSSACKEALIKHRYHNVELKAMSLLLWLGASPNSPGQRELDSWELSPLHILALAEERPVVQEALEMLLNHGADINHRARLHLVKYSRHIRIDVLPSQDGLLAETALEYAIQRSRWNSAIRFLSAGCELTGREILFIHSASPHYDCSMPVRQESVAQFISALLAKAPSQAAALHWSGLTVVERAIQNENKDMILELLGAGVSPNPSDFLYMLCNRTEEKARVCLLPSNIQMELVLAAEASKVLITNVSTVRLFLAYACPGVVRHILKGFPDLYDSEGLCYLIVRLISKDKAHYFFLVFCGNFEKDHEPEDTISMNDLVAFVSRRNESNRHEDWESTAVTIAARAGRADIIRILIGTSQDDLRNNGFIPKFLLKEALICDQDVFFPSGAESDELNWGRMGVWIKYCRMDDPNMRCSPLTAAAMVEPEIAREEVVDLLLALNYQPDGWTVLVASSQGRLSILQRLTRLECWPHILEHKDRPDWCPTALQMAVYSTNVSTVRFLLDTRTVIDEIDLSPCRPFCFAPPVGTPNKEESPTMLPRTALQHAVENEDMELVTLLVNAGADVNAPAAINSGATALQIASIQGSIPMVEYLISHGADPYAPGAAKHGRTALQGAAEHGRKDIVELLLAHGTSMAYWHRGQLTQAILYAEKNAQHVVASILRESLPSPWSSEEEETLEFIQENWESSSEHSEFHHSRAEIEVWEKTFEKGQECLWADESNLSFGTRSGEPQMENSQGDDAGFPQDMEFGIDGQGGSHIGQIGEDNLDNSEVASMLALQEHHVAWIEGQSCFEGHRVDDRLLGDFFMEDYWYYLYSPFRQV